MPTQQRKEWRSARGRAPIQVGDVVGFDFGGRIEGGPVVEDRGPLGRNGARLLRVRLDLPYGAEPLFINMPEQELKIVRRKRPARPAARTRVRHAA